jgi:2-methylisocitrate lyase-like PEP mutase family enzyme
MSAWLEKRARFRALHQSGCFVIPNPWDGASALRMQKAGFSALASTSAGAAWALGKADGEMTLDEVLHHLRFLCALVDVPVNADFEAGFAETSEEVAVNVARCIETGVAGLSIEDGQHRRMFSLAEAAERVAAARQAIDASGAEVILIGRCEAYLMNPLDMDAVIARLKAYGAAGADCLYAPGLRDLASIAQVVEAVDKPVNANLSGTTLSVRDMASVGVRRVSVGGALANATYGALDGFIDGLTKDGRLP